jgi:excisionase family DNA binding protein
MAGPAQISESAKVFLTAEEAAARLRLGRTTIFELIESGELVSVLVGRSRRVPAKAVEMFAARLVAEQCGTAIAQQLGLTFARPAAP